MNTEWENFSSPIFIVYIGDNVSRPLGSRWSKSVGESDVYGQTASKKPVHGLNCFLSIWHLMVHKQEWAIIGLK